MESQWVVNGKEPRASRICSWYILFSLNLKLGEPHKMDPQMTLKTILATHWPSELLDEFTPLRAFHDFAVKSQDDKTGRINSQGSHHVRKQLGPVGSQSWWRLKEQSFLHMLPWGPSAVFLLLALLKWSDFSEVQQHLAMSGNSYLFIAPIGSQVGNLDNYPMILLACWAYLGIVHFTAPSNPSSGLLDLFLVLSLRPKRWAKSHGHSSCWKIRLCGMGVPVQCQNIEDFNWVQHCKALGIQFAKLSLELPLNKHLWQSFLAAACHVDPRLVTPQL